MNEHQQDTPVPAREDQANSIQKQQNKRPVDLSSERIGLDDNSPAVLPIGTGGVPPEAK